MRQALSSSSSISSFSFSCFNCFACKSNECCSRIYDNKVFSTNQAAAKGATNPKKKKATPRNVGLKAILVMLGGFTLETTSTMSTVFISLVWSANIAARKWLPLREGKLRRCRSPSEGPLASWTLACMFKWPVNNTKGEIKWNRVNFFLRQWLQF